MSDDITLRDYFAAKALQSLIAASTTLDDSYQESFVNAANIGLLGDLDCTDMDDKAYTYASYWADDAYVLADAMIARRNKK